MQRHQRGKLAAWQWALVGSGSTLVLALAVFGSWNLISPKLQGTTIASSATNNVDNRLVGQWQFGENINYIFTHDGKSYDISGSQATIADYKVVSSTSQSIEIQMHDGELSWIMDFMSDGSVLLKDRGHAVKGRKISDEVSLPPNVEKIIPARSVSDRAKESEALTYTLSINKAQQYFFKENNRFSPTLQDLDISSIEDSPFYDYEVRLDSPRLAIVTATATADGLKSFTGIAFLKEDDNEGFTDSKACSTEQPSRTPPPLPSRTPPFCPSDKL
jgi:hypothetical protein